jgi:hypothetical protein
MKWRIKTGRRRENRIKIKYGSASTIYFLNYYKMKINTEGYWYMSM